MVLSQTLFADTGSFNILRLLLVAAEQVDIVVVLLCSRGLGSIQSSSDDVRSVDGERLTHVTGKRYEVVVVANNVLVPTRSVRVLGSSRVGIQGLEDGYIGLGWREAIDVMS